MKINQNHTYQNCLFLFSIIGLVIEPKKKYSQTVQSSFHVSGAVVDPAFKGGMYYFSRL